MTAWDRLQDEKARKFCGTAFHETTFTPDPGLLRTGLRIYLALGRVNVMAKVTVNGKVFETLWMPPFAVDVTELLEKGENQLKVEVTSRCPGKEPGLLGPVRLRATTRKDLTK